jgi:hypothetical protein
MSIIDFKEIPQANTGEGNQDSFEAFARDFLFVLGYEIDEGPSRGADGGKDLIVTEKMMGILSSTKIRWLVSCKHYAHSGKAIGGNDEVDIIVRVEKFKCSGFMAFYSTLPSSGLQDTFSRLKDKMSIEVIDGARIEHLLLNESNLIKVAARYFPQSFRNERQLETEYYFQQETMLYEYEYKTRKDEAIRQRDALGLVHAEREYKQKIELAQRKRELAIKYLKGE